MQFKLLMIALTFIIFKPVMSMKQCLLEDYMAVNNNNQELEVRILRNEYKKYTKWRIKHNKGKINNCDLKQQFRNWRYNNMQIDKHNAKGHNYTLTLNKFSDKVWNNRFNNHPNSHNNLLMKHTRFNKPLNFIDDYSLLPKAVDWRLKGYVTNVKNQGECGSCWTFSTTGSIEGALVKAGLPLVSLSESQILDCDTGGSGCNGGLMDQAFKYVEQYGLETEHDYPYLANDEECSYDKSKAKYKISKYVDIKGGEMELMRAVAENGPVSVAIDASQHTFRLYNDGVYYSDRCSSTNLDHGVLVVGYNTTVDGNDYWIVKNSWGNDWGVGGYIYMSRNKDNNCGIATYPSYPIV